MFLTIKKYNKYLRQYYFSSGTGKSTLLKQIVEENCVTEQDKETRIKGFNTKKKSHLYLINVDSKDFKMYKKTFPDAEKIEFEKLENAKRKSCIVVEDIIHMTKKDEKTLRQAINFQTHHKSQKIICATHSIFKTNLFSILMFFHYIIITSAAANVPSLRNLFKYFKVDINQENEWIEKFKKFGQGQHGVYFYFHCSEMTFNVSFKMLFKKTKCLGTLGDENSITSSSSSSSSPTLDSRQQTLQKRFNQIVTNHPLQNEANSIFSILICCLDKAVVRDKDLTVIFLDKKTGKKKLISLVDYIFILLSEKTIVPLPISTLHKFIKTICHIPQTFIRNKYMR